MTRFLALVLVAFGLLFAAPAHAQQNLFITRLDAGSGRTPGYSIGVITPYIEAWSFGNGTDIELGHLWPVYKSKHSLVLLGGYAAVWPETEEYFFVPWLTAKYWDGRLRASLDIAGYLPFNGGPTALLVSDAFLGYQVTDRLTVGIGSGFFHTEDYFKNVPIGPSLKYQLNKRTSISARYLFEKDGDNTFRLQINHGF